MSAERKEFEAWASSPEFGLSQAHFSLDEDGEYVNYPAHCYWLVWQGCQKRMKELVDSANANLENAVAHMQSVCAERDRLNSLLIEREATRIGQGLQRHDDQKQIDELVALGIQQDKDEIEQLKAENAELRRDAERYRWLREGKNSDGPSMVSVYATGELDNVIDRAISKEQK